MRRFVTEFVTFSAFLCVLLALYIAAPGLS
jgi:hypothetical protein